MSCAKHQLDGDPEQMGGPAPPGRGPGPGEKRLLLSAEGGHEGGDGDVRGEGGEVRRGGDRGVEEHVVAVGAPAGLWRIGP